MMIVNIPFDDQQLSVLAEVMGTVSLPMKLTLPLMQHIEKHVNEQRQKASEEKSATPPQPKPPLTDKAKATNGINAAP